MRFAWFKTGIFAALMLSAAAAGAQLNPHTNVRWPAACGSGPGMVYNFQSNTCINMNAISPATQLTWPAACGTGPGMVYNSQTNTCINMNAISAATQVTWPISCSTSSSVYNPLTQTCIANGTAANPAGTAGQMQYNLGGVFGAIAGSTADSSGNVTFATVKASLMANVKIASLYQTGGGNNGIANAQAASQKVLSDPGYPITEAPTVATFTATPTWWVDERNSQSNEFFRNPATDTTGLPVNTGRFGTYGMWGKNISCQYDTNFKTNSSDNRNNCMELHYTRMGPGSNLGNLGVGPGGWNVGINLVQSTIGYSKGILESTNTQQTQNATGDNIAWYCYLYYQGGYTAPSDEGNKCLGMNITEQNAAFAGTATGGPLTNPTAVTTTPIYAGGLQGAGRYVIKRGACSSYPTTCPAAPYSGTITNVAAGLDGTMSALTVTSTLPVSNAWGTLSGNCNTGTPNGDSPFSNSVTCTVTLTSGSFTCTAGSSVTGACSPSPQPPLICFAGNYHDCTVPTAVGTASSTQTITVPARMQHASGTRVFQGGMAGYGQEMTAYTQKPNGAQPMPYLSEVYGSTDAHTIQGGWFKIGNSQASLITSGAYQFFNMQPTLSSVGTTVSGQYLLAGSTLTAPYNSISGSTIMIANADDVALNGLCSNIIWTPSIAGTANIFFSCTHAGLTGTHTNTSSTPTGMLTNNGVTLNSYNLYPMAEVTDVRNNSVNPPTVDGTLALEPNVLGTVNTGDVLEETHHFAVEAQTITGLEVIYNPYSQTHFASWGIQGAGASGGSSSFSSNSFATLSNANPETMYAGTGGVLGPPNFIMAPGNWLNGFMFDHAPATGIFISPSTAQLNNPNLSTNIFQVIDKSATTQLSVTPNTGDAILLTPRILTLAGAPVVIQSDLGAQTFRNQITVSAMATPVLTVTPKIGQGGTLADGTYYYQVQARGGSFFSPRSNEATCVITGGSGTGSCVLSWAPIAGTSTAYIPSGRATSGGELNFTTTAVNGIASTLWTDTGALTPSGGAFTSTVPPIVVGTVDITKAFTASGASHVMGLVPDPGVTAGTTKYLREDSTWAVPIAPTKYSGISITPAAVTASSCAEQTFNTYTGLATGQGVYVSPPATPGAHVWIGSSRVSATNTLAITFCGDATSGTPVAGVYVAVAF